MACMTADSLRWNHIYPKVLAAILAGVVLALLLPLPAPPNGPGPIITIVQLLFIATMSMRGGFWFGLSAPQFGGACVSRYALLPIGFDEVSRLMFKIACFRGVLIVPLLVSVMSTMCIAMHDQSDWHWWGLGGIIASFLYLIAHGWIIAVRFAESLSSPVSGQTRWYWQSVRLATSSVGATVLGSVSLVTTLTTIGLLGDAGFLTETQLPYVGLGVLALFTASSLAVWVCVRAMYRRGIVDLVRSRPSVAPAGMATVGTGMVFVAPSKWLSHGILAIRPPRPAASAFSRYRMTDGLGSRSCDTKAHCCSGAAKHP